MSREERRRRLQAQRDAGGRTFTDNLRHLFRTPVLLLQLLVVMGVISAVCVLLLPADWEGIAISAIGIPVTALLIGRSVR
ncbi:hypothetical protein [Actinomadura alba]|uniref:Uncharacterized protein n=1 Tax=Actinomadura alba TaxID=406431 RepID=A0ABR7LPU8_9ACTN|nr:hypothetical protein [Actinomadura alba]MBC6466781.1 hypothetical protein [Actinomadura alba]